jgi:hypothetical protein
MSLPALHDPKGPRTYNTPDGSLRYEQLSRRQKRSVRRTLIRSPKPNTAWATSECKCHAVFSARTSREAIAARREHQAATGHK